MNGVVKMRKRFKYKIIFPGLARLPFAIGYKAAAFYWQLDKSHREEVKIVLKSGFDKCLPYLVRDENFVTGAVQQYLNMMAHEMMDIFYLDHSAGQNSLDLVTLKGAEYLKAAQSEQTGVILIGAHYGRPAMLSSRIGIAGYHHGFITQNIDKNPELCPQDAAYLNAKMAIALRFAQGTWVSKGNTKDMYRALQRGETLMTSLDVLEMNPAKTKEFNFLGGKLRIPYGIVRLAEKTGARMVYGISHCQGRKVTAQLRKLPEDPYEGLKQAVAELEQDVLASPAHWWQWSILDYFWRPSDVQ